MTENRFGNVRFDGVCTDTSNAAYPVDAVVSAVEADFDPPHDEAAIHLALTLLHRGYVERVDDGRGNGFVLSEAAHELRDSGRLVAEVCAAVEPRVRDGDEGDAAAFVGFVDDVIETVAEDV